MLLLSLISYMSCLNIRVQMVGPATLSLKRDPPHSTRDACGDSTLERQKMEATVEM